MHHPSLWEYAESTQQPKPASASSPENRVPAADTSDRDQVRKQAIKRLRSSGHWQTLLRVARTIAQPFTLNDISVAVWRACPEFFGMRGYPYPDNHKVHYILYGDRGLIAKGLVLRVRQGVFRLPDGPAIEAALPSNQADPA